MVYNGNTVLGEALLCKRKYEARKINNFALDGTPYQQTTGDATHRREVKLFSATYSERDAADRASNKGALISVEWRGATYKGYIENNITWREAKDEHGVGSFDLIVKEVVEDA